MNSPTIKPRKAPEAKRVVAAFDFDGTLARGDAVIPFTALAAGKRATTKAMISLLPQAMKLRLGKGDRDEMKAEFVAATFTGLSESHVLEKGREFATHLIHKRMQPTVLGRLRWHQLQGHEVWLVSATLHPYLVPVAETLKVNRAICTHIAFSDGRSTGQLSEGNIRGPEKARQLTDTLGIDVNGQNSAGKNNVELWAYGNSSGDYEMLELAQHAFWVNKHGNIAQWSGRSDSR